MSVSFCRYTCPRETYKSSTIVCLENNVNLPLLIWQFRDIDQSWAHGAVIGLDVFGKYRLLYNCRFDNRRMSFTYSGVGNAFKKFFLGLKSFISLSFAKLFQPISNDNLMETLQSGLS